MKRISSRVRYGRAAVATLALFTGAAGVVLTRREPVPVTQDRGADVACATEFRQLERDPDEAQVQRALSCAAKEDGERRGDAHGKLHPDLLRLVGIHAMIPEYHDEQRLPSGMGNRLGPQAGIYASPNLDDFTRLWQFNAHDTKGVLVAYVVVGRLTNEPLPPTYQALGLGFGLNCLWLVRQAGAAQWSAIVGPALGGGGRICDRDNQGGTSLTVVPTTVAGTVESDYPAVARFGESNAGDPLLGIKCLDAWCEIGAGNFVPRSPLAQTYGLTSIKARVKGWHDEQLLSTPEWVRPAMTSYFFERTTIRAALVPEDGVENLTKSRFQNTWTPVGSVVLDRDPPAGSKYARWGLKQGVNRIELKWDLVGGREVWAAQMWAYRAAAPTTWRFNQREEHWDVGIPGTLRFRWTIMDDGVWAPCGQSCCQVEGPPA